MRIKTPSAGLAIVTLTIVTATIVVGMTDREYDRTTAQFTNATPTDDKFHVIGERDLSDIAPISEQVKYADYISYIRIDEVRPTRFNTTTGLRPDSEDESLGMLIGTPLVVDVIENYKIPAGASAPSGWALLMIGGTHDEVTHQ